MPCRPVLWASGRGTLKRSACSMQLSTSLPPLEGKVNRRLWGFHASLCLLAAGFQAFEIQLVLRQALPNIWTVLRDQGVSSRLGVGSLRGSISPSASEKGSLSSSPRSPFVRLWLCSQEPGIQRTRLYFCLR